MKKAVFGVAAAASLGVCGAALAGNTTAHADEVHNVQPGETVSQIANQYHVSVDSIAQANHLNGDDLIVAGQQIHIPSVNGQQQQAVNTQTAVYTVQSGDTLSKIANEFHVSVNDLVNWNHLSSDVIFIGQQLIVKAPAAQPQQQHPVVKEVITTTTTTTTTHNGGNAATPQQQSAPVHSTGAVNTNVNSGAGLDSANQAAKNWIASRESGGNYNASNGNYYGKYQLSRSYLGGDYSPAHQEQVANQYVASRYGSWINAKAHWMSCGWY